VPQIEVTFDIDANGIVNVSAKDKATNKEQQIRIQASGGLSDAEIDKMVKEAEANAAEDKKRKDLVEAKNQAEGLIHSTNKTLADLGDKINEGDKAAATDAIAEVKAAIESGDVEAITAKTTQLAQSAMKLGEIAYKQAGGGASAEASANASSGGDDADDVLDADFEEVKDDDKK
jgi:molecular chaperone DnaK